MVVEFILDPQTMTLDLMKGGKLSVSLYVCVCQWCEMRKSDWYKLSIVMVWDIIWGTMMTYLQWWHVTQFPRFANHAHAQSTAALEHKKQNSVWRSIHYCWAAAGRSYCGSRELSPNEAMKTSFFATLAVAALQLCSAHVRLTFPPARLPDYDFLDNVRTGGPCGVPGTHTRSTYKNTL